MARQRAAFEEQRRAMLLGVSHDMRSPLTRIRVAADLATGLASLTVEDRGPGLVRPG